MATPQVRPRSSGERNPVQATETELLELILHKPSRQRTVDPALVLRNPKRGVEIRVVFFSGATYSALLALDRSIRTYLERTAVPLALPLKRSVYLLSKALMPAVEAELAAKLEKRRKLTKRLVDEHQNLLDEFLKAFLDEGKTEAQALFPSRSELRRALGVEQRWIPWDDFASHLWEDTARYVVHVLRREVCGLIQVFEHSLGRTASGRKRPVHASTTAQIRHFLDVFDHRLLRADPELEALVERAGALFLGEDPETFLRGVRRDDDRRREVQAEASLLLAEAKRLLAASAVEEQEGLVH